MTLPRYIFTVLLLASVFRLAADSSNPWPEGATPALCYFYKNASGPVTVEADSILCLAGRLLAGCDSRYRLAVPDSLIGFIKTDGLCLELTFAQEFVLSVREPPKYLIRKILIPCSGLYSTDEANATPIIFLGREAYFSGPVGNSEGLPLRDRLAELLRLSLPRKD